MGVSYFKSADLIIKQQLNLFKMEKQKKSRRTITLVTATALCWIIGPGVVYAADDPVVYGITPGRLVSLVGGVVGLISVISGGLALRPSARLGFKKRGAIIARTGGLVCIVFSLVNLARANGAIGTGSGKLGAIVAIVLGVVGLILGSVAMARYRKKVIGSSNPVSS